MTAEISTTLVNGLPDATIDISDRGFSYGHGVFETIRTSAHRPLLWQLHIGRLKRGCSVLKINLPDNIEAILLDDISRLLEHSRHDHSVVKLTITAGSGRGYAPPENPEYQRVVSLLPLIEYPESAYEYGVEVRTCDYRLPRNPVLAGIKHLNRLDQVLARAEWQNDAIAEGIMLDSGNIVIEGVMTNLFGCVDGKLITPNLDKAGVWGTMRDYLLSYANEQDLQTEVLTLTEAEFRQSDELFICNSVIGVLPIRKWGDRLYSPGKITRSIQARVNRLFYGQSRNMPGC